MSLPYLLELERQEQMVWVKNGGMLSPLGAISLERLLEAGEKGNGQVILREAIDQPDQEVSLEEARWRRLEQKAVVSDYGFLLSSAIRLALVGEHCLDLSTGATTQIVLGDGLRQTFASQGLTIEAAERIMSGQAVEIQEHPFGPLTVVEVKDL